MAQPEIAFAARPCRDKFGCVYYGLFVGRIQWGALRWRNGEWFALGYEEDLGKCLRAAVYDHRNAPLSEALAACRRGYMYYFYPDQTVFGGGNVCADADVDAEYDGWARNLGDASGAGQDWDANHGFDC